MRAINIKTGAIIFGMVACATILAVVVAGQLALSQLRIGGPVYGQLVRDSSLVSDILPPPQYIVESYLESVMALQKPNSLPEHRTRMQALRKQYEDRHRYWMAQPISPVIKKMLTGQSDSSVRKFYKIAEERFLPALGRRDIPAAQAAFSDMTAAYQAHHAAIDKIVTIAKQESNRTEAAARDEQRFWAIVTWSVSALVMVLLVWRIIWLILFVARPLDQIASAIRQVSKNPREARIEATNRRDEIGSIISAIAAFRDGLLDAERMKAELIENQIAARSATEANKAKSAFLANMSHELRTPLNAIIGFSDFMIQGLYGPLSEKYLEYSEHINKSGLHLLDVISDILDMAKVEAGKFELSLEKIDLEEIVSDCVAMIAPRARERGADITISGTKGVFLGADRRALRQMLLNLLSNAAKFCSEAGKIEVRAVSAADHLSIAIHDDGKGISPEHIARLGRPFEQVTENSNLARGGTGLGLALVYAMAERHGGSVRIESRVGEGTTVHVKLPWIDPQACEPIALARKTKVGRDSYPLSAVS